MQIQITSAGQALFDAEPAGIAITRVDFGDGFNYAPAPDPTGLQGDVVYQSNVVSNPLIVDPSTLKYIVRLGKEIATFQFGEIAIYNEATLVGVGVSPTLITKAGPQPGSDGNVTQISFYVDTNQTLRYAMADVETTGVGFPTVPVPDFLRPPKKNSPNAYVINGVTVDAIPYFAYADPTGKWSFSTKTQVYHEGTVVVPGTFGTSFDLTQSTAYTGDVGDLVLQFVSGPLRGYCRALTMLNIGDEALSWNTPLNILPNAGDEFIIVGPPAAAGGGSAPAEPDNRVVLGSGTGLKSSVNFQFDPATGALTLNGGVGDAGQVPTSGGAGQPVAWATPSGGGGGGFTFQIGVPPPDGNHIHYANLSTAQANALMTGTDPLLPVGDAAQPTVQIESNSTGTPGDEHTHTLTLAYDYHAHTFVVLSISNNALYNHEAWQVGKVAIENQRLGLGNKFAVFMDGAAQYSHGVNLYSDIVQRDFVEYSDYDGVFNLKHSGVYSITADAIFTATATEFPLDATDYSIELEPIDDLQVIAGTGRFAVWRGMPDATDTYTNTDPKVLSISGKWVVMSTHNYAKKFFLRVRLRSFGNSGETYSYKIALDIERQQSVVPLIYDVFEHFLNSFGTPNALQNVSTEVDQGNASSSWYRGLTLVNDTFIDTNDGNIVKTEGLIVEPINGSRVYVEPNVLASPGPWDAILDYVPQSYTEYAVEWTIVLGAGVLFSDQEVRFKVYAAVQDPLLGASVTDGMNGQNYVSADFEFADSNDGPSWRFPSTENTNIDPSGTGTGFMSADNNGTHLIRMEVTATELRLYFDGNLLETCTRIVNANPWDIPGRIGFGMTSVPSNGVRLDKVTVNAI